MSFCCCFFENDCVTIIIIIQIIYLISIHLPGFFWFNVMTHSSSWSSSGPGWIQRGFATKWIAGIISRVHRISYWKSQEAVKTTGHRVEELISGLQNNLRQSLWTTRWGPEKRRGHIHCIYNWTFGCYSFNYKYINSIPTPFFREAILRWCREGDFVDGALLLQTTRVNLRSVQIPIVNVSGGCYCKT